MAAHRHTGSAVAQTNETVGTGAHSPLRENADKLDRPNVN